MKFLPSLVCRVVIVVLPVLLETGSGTLRANPSITLQPASAAALIGASTNFAVNATGNGTLHYQWCLNGVNLGADSSGYTVASVQNTNLGFYSVVVSDNDGGVTSANAALSVPLMIVNWSESFEWGVNGTSLNGTNGWAKAAGAANITISTAQARGGTRSAYIADYSYRSTNNFGSLAAGTHCLATFWMYDTGNTKEYCDVRQSGTLAQLWGVSKNDGSDSNAGGNYTQWYQGRIYAPANYWSLVNSGVHRANDWHKHQVERVDATTANFYIDGILGYTATGLTADGTWSLVVIGNGATAGANAFYVDDISIATFTGSSGTNPIILVQPQSLAITQGLAATLSVVALPGSQFSSTDTLSYQWLKNGVGIPGATASSYSIGNPQSADVGAYAAIVVGQGGTVQSQDAALAIAEPTLDAQSPPGGPLAAGATSEVTFSVSAHASRPINYQWGRNGGPLTDGGNISGASTPILTVRSLGGGDAGSYSCLLTNSDGFTNSAAVVLTVTTVPFINLQPTNQTVVLGSNAAFRVAAAGPDLTYQWRKGAASLTDGGRISGAASSALTIASVAALDAGSYSCLITNSYGAVTSSPGILTLITPPVITTQPAGQSVFLTSNALFHVVAQGTAPLAYQWSKDGAPLANGGNISGAATPDLTVAVNAWTDEGVYAVSVSNAAGGVTSYGAQLLAVPAGVPSVQDIVNQYSPANYQNTLSNKLFTRQGMNRTDITGGQHDLCRTNIYAEFQRAGQNPYLDLYNFVDTSGVPRTGCNVVAVQPGILNPSNEIYVVSGHYDSTANHESGGWTSAPGADDNASGIAAVLEMARIFRHYNFARTIVFCAFDNEEISDYGNAHHRLGSVHYVSQHSTDNIKGMISVDMIAWQSPVTLHNMADIESRNTMTTIRNQLSAAINTYGGGLQVDIRGNPGDFSDHVAFADAGFQACMLIEDNWWNNPNYHLMTDYVEYPGYIDWTYAGKMCKSAIGYFAARLQPVAEPAFLLSAGPGPDGNVTLTCAGTPGCTYAIEVAAELRAPVWFPLQTNTAGLDGILTVTDPQASGRPAGFYRARWVP